MARFSDNPLKNPLAGNEIVPGTDPSTTDDIGFTPDVLTQFVQENMGLASGSSQGAISGPDGDKLTALRTKAQDDAIFAQVAQIPFPIFIGTPVDGTIEIFRNVLDNDIVFDFMWYALSSGSTTLTILIDGTPITGWTNLPVTTASTGAVATAAKTIPPGSILALQFASSSSPQNLRLTLKGDLTLT